MRGLLPRAPPPRIPKSTRNIFKFREDGLQNLWGALKKAHDHPPLSLPRRLLEGGTDDGTFGSSPLGREQPSELLPRSSQIVYVL